MNDMKTIAIAHNEVLTSYVAAGFTRAEALQLLIAQIRDSNGGGHK